MQWNTSKLYKDISDPQIEKDIQTCIKKNKAFALRWKNNRKYLEDAKTLSIALKEYEQLQQRYGQCTKPHYYLFLLNSLNQTDTEIKAKLNKVSAISTQLENEIQFFELNISKVNVLQQRNFLKSTHLKNYKHYLEQLFTMSKYLLSEKEEKIFNLTSKTGYSNWVNMVSELLDKQKFCAVEEDRIYQK